MPLTSQQLTKYTPVIDFVLKSSNLDEISSKRVRTELQTVVAEDLTEYKMDINDLIHERFDVANAKRNSEVVNGNAQGISERSGSEVNADGVTPEDDHDQPVQPPPRKKQKTGKAESDAAMAARLQAEENGRARPTRGGSSRSSTKKKSSSVRKSPKKKKNKSESKINEDDDSAENSTSEEKKTSKRGGAFNAPWQLSEPLAALTGEQQLSRPQAVKRIWDYVKANNLQHEGDKRQIHCDNAMRAIFNQDNVHMFTMNKILSKHLYPIPGENDGW